MNSVITVELPRGYWLNGVCYRQAGLHSLTGEDEVFLEEVGPSLLPAQRVTALLARCLTYLGPLNPVTADVVRELTAGDREALLLSLRRLTLGDPMACVVNCPYPNCKARMDLEVKVSDLLFRSHSSSEPFHEAKLIGQGKSYRVRFRVPAGADQETLALLAREDCQAAADLLLRRCVEWVLDEEGQSEEEIPPSLTSQISNLMAELDPQAEVVLSLVCPTCGRMFLTLFDTASYFFQEMADRMKDVYREVHLLALHYHWSEGEILAMTGQKRRVYLDLLAKALCEEEDG